MPVAWYAAPYVPDPSRPRARMVAIEAYTSMIQQDQGAWSETEILGGWAVVKVRATQATLDLIAQDTQFRRIPLTRLDDSWATLSPAQRNALRSFAVSLGYTTQELTAALGSDLSAVTLGQFLRFCATRRRKPRWDETTGTIVLDGPVQPCRSVDDVDRSV